MIESFSTSNHPHSLKNGSILPYGHSHQLSLFFQLDKIFYFYIYSPQKAPGIPSSEWPDAFLISATEGQECPSEKRIVWAFECKIKQKNHSIISEPIIL